MREMIVISGIVAGAIVFTLIVVFLIRRYNALKTEFKTFCMMIPRDDESTLEAATNMFTALYGLREPWYGRIFRPQGHLTLEMYGKEDVSMYVTVPDRREMPERFKTTAMSSFPNSQIVELDEVDIDARKKAAMCQLKQAKHPVFPLKTTQFEEGKDPVEAITNALANPNLGEKRLLQILAKPVGKYWKSGGRRYLERLKRERSLEIPRYPWIPDLSSVIGKVWETIGDIVTNPDNVEMRSAANDTKIPEEIVELEDYAKKKLTRNSFRAEIRLIVQSDDCRYYHVEGLADSFRVFDGYNRLEKNRVWPWSKPAFLAKARRRIYPLLGSRTILDTQELGSIFHPPGALVQTRGLRRSFQREKEASVNIPTEGRIIGISVDRGNERPVALSRVDEATHIIGFGRTGMGKTEWIKNLIHEGLRDGCGGIYIDPHGTAAKELLGQVDDCFLDRVLYWAPWDEEHALGFNVLEKSGDIITANEESLIVESAIDVFESTWKITDIMVRLKHYLRYGLHTLVEYPGPMTVLELRPLYLNTGFRKAVLSRIGNPEIQEFWRDEWDRLQERQRYDFIMSLLDRLSSIDLDNRMKHILGQDESQIDFTQLMDEGKFLIVDLDMSKMGESNASLLGTLIVSKVFQASMGRKHRDKLFRMYIDEAQNFMTYTYAKVLSQSRKFGLCQYLWVQYLEQLTPEVRSAVLGNVGTYICLRAGIEDAELVAPYFSRTQLHDEIEKTKEDIINLDPYHALVKTSINKESLPPFKMKSLPMMREGDPEQAEFLVESTFHFHCKRVKTREEIEEMIRSRQSISAKENDKTCGHTSEMKDNSAELEEGIITSRGHVKPLDTSLGVLLWINDHGPITCRQFQDRTNVSQSAGHKRLEKLVKKGYLKKFRRTNIANEPYYYEVTDKGKFFIDRHGDGEDAA